MKRQMVIDSLNELPREFALEELFERLVVLEKIEEGRKDVREGRIYTHSEAKKELGKWIK